MSRFGRNTVDTLTYTRELKLLGIDVYFEKEAIHSTSPDGELMLTLMAAFAEPESESMSENVKWGLRATYVWHCNNEFTKRKYCSTLSVKEESIEQCFVYVFNSILAHLHGCFRLIKK